MVKYFNSMQKLLSIFGKKNSKWSPVCQSSFSNIIDTEKAEKSILRTY